MIIQLNQWLLFLNNVSQKGIAYKYFLKPESPVPETLLKNQAAIAANNIVNLNCCFIFYLIIQRSPN